MTDVNAEHTEAEQFSIRDLADEFHITTRTIRFYEDKGLLSPQRQGQRRIFHKRDRARLKLILRGKRLGFSLQEICDLVELYTAPEDEKMQLQKYLQTLREHQKTLTQQKQDLEKTLHELAHAEQECQRQLSALTSE